MPTAVPVPDWSVKSASAATMLSASCCALLALKNLPRLLIDACHRSSIASGPPAPVAGGQSRCRTSLALMPFG
jgi:hypothetical protein